MLPTRDEFVRTGGDPSGSYFSTYTDICNLLKKNDDMPTLGFGRGNFYNRDEIKLIIKLNAKVEEFQISKHKHAKGAGVAKKDREKKAVEDLKDSMKNEVNYAKISQVLLDHAGSATPLIRNSVLGWQDKFQQRGWSISFISDMRVNAQWSNKAMAVNPDNVLTKPALFVISIFVHEYHHVLTEKKPDIYTDEFVAHWKQYLVYHGNRPINNDTDRARCINTFLLDDPNGYIGQITSTGAIPRTRYSGPADAGSTWNDTRDNILRSAVLP